MEIEEYIIDEDTVCGTCQAEFLDANDLQMHISQYHPTHTNLKSYCPFCAQGFPDLDDYSLHMRNEHFHKIRYCKYCTRFFIDEDILKNHEAQHRYSDMNDKISCSQCDTICDGLQQLESHEFTEHRFRDDSVMLQDMFPNLSSLLNMNIKFFMQSLSEHLLFNCVRCSYSTFDVTTFIEHLKIENEQCYACDYCYNVFKKKVTLSRHCKSHLSGNSVQVSAPYQCKRCNKIFNKTNLKNHLKTCVDMKCDKCNLSFDSVTKYAEHAASHAAEKTVPLEVCKYCQRPFVGLVSLKKHVARQHKHEIHLYKYHCKHCDKIFKHPKLLFGHFFSTHKDIKPYLCKICNISFRMRRNFTLHIKMDHKSAGFVEFDDQFYVHFNNKKTKKGNSDIGEAEIVKDKNNLVEINKNSDSDDKSKEIEAEINITVEEVETRTIDESKEYPESKVEDVTTDVINLGETKDSEMDNNVLAAEESENNNSKRKNVSDFSSDDSDVPLAKVVKRKKISQKRKRSKKNTSKFICSKCNRNCYTYQNFQRHAALHKNNKWKSCVKCHKSFRHENKLKKHIMEKHSSSKLTETLKRILERKVNSEQSMNGEIQRSKDENVNEENQRVSGLDEEQDKIEWIETKTFQSTLKKVDIEECTTCAKITPVRKDQLSAKNFLESFMPDSQETKVTVSSSLSIKKVTANKAPPFIKLTKYTPEPIVSGKPRLRMPVKYRTEKTEVHEVSIKVVNVPSASNFSLNTSNYYNPDFESVPTTIPDVAEEVMLDNIEKPLERTVVIKDILNTDNINIAHLWPQEPYYKIVKINDVVNEASQKEEVKREEPELTLPNGTKLVNVNPLSHLLGDRNINDIHKAKNNYYQPKVKNIGQALAKALMKLNKTKRKERRK